MGNCSSVEVETSTSQPHPQPSPMALALAQTILSRFSVGRQISEMMSGVSYTESQGKDLAKALIQGIVSLEKVQTIEEKQAVQQLFNEENIQMIREEKLFYYGMLDKLKIKPISQNSKSRIYHTIANIKKEKNISQSGMNKYDIYCIKSNNYKELSKDELQEIVKYESIADHIRQLGDTVRFKFQSIKSQSEKMAKLLTECMKKHIGSINKLKYDLSEEQVNEVAKISRQCCNYYDNGVFILLVYFVQCCKILQNKSMTTESIQQLLKKAIEEISNMYPPGKGLSQQNQGLKNMLKDLEDTNKYTKIEFLHETRVLKTTNKQEEVQSIITQYAQIAEANKQLFQELIQVTCLSKCVYFKVGLKYYPNKPNKKALTRIKEKMFFKKQQKSDSAMKGNIKAILDQQQLAYRTIIDEILKDTDSIQFKISDMVRGKCVFVEIIDIIQSVNAIKRLVEKNPRYGIVEIQSRFTNKVPISDVTLKIVLNNQIVAELQLTIQTNAATYNFAHKIYELQRTKVFSKLKITHNYLQESKDDFDELAKKAFELESVKSNLLPQQSKQISQYFNLGLNSKSFKRIIQEVVDEKNISINDLIVSVDPILQDLILIAFSLAIGRWGKLIGKLINQNIKNQNNSTKLKSVVLSIFFEAFQLQLEAQYMQQLGLTDFQLQDKIFMEEYMREYFQIQKAFKYVKQNQKLFSRAQQLKRIVFSKYFKQELNLLSSEMIFINNLVIEQLCSQQLKRLKEMFNFYFASRESFQYQYKTYDLISRYYKWIQNDLKQNKSTQNQILNSQISIVKAQLLLEYKNQAISILQSQCILQQALQVFNKRQLYSRVIECQILLTECYFKCKIPSLNQMIAYHDKKVVQKAQILGQELKGALYADSMWRISVFLWKIYGKSKYKKQVLSSFIKIAISQMSRSKGEQFIIALSEILQQYDKQTIEKPQIKKNQKIQYFQLTKLKTNKRYENLIKAKWNNLKYLNLFSNQIDAVGCEYLSKGDWKNLTNLSLYHCMINQKGCEYLSKGNWKNLTTLDIGGNSVSDIGCEHLSKADWKNLTTLNLYGNHIEDIGCEHLIKANWKNLTKLILSLNMKIKPTGYEHLSKADWKNLTTLDLSRNDINQNGCESLSKADWKNLTTLDLSENRIQGAGAGHLSKTNWKNLTTLYLDKNGIQDDGAGHLVQAGWKNLTSLSLDQNYIRKAGAEHLSKSDWKNLTTLNLEQNDLQDYGCEHLIKADWKNLTKLNLNNNSIKDIGCEHLIKADWKNLTSLYLNRNRNITLVGCAQLAKGNWPNFTYIELCAQSLSDKNAVKKLFTKQQVEVRI